MMEEYACDVIQEEHVNVRRLIGIVGATLVDLDVFFRLQTERFELSQVSLQGLADKCSELGRTVQNLWQDLKKHFEYEEEHLPQILGKTLTQALKLEHEDIERMMELVLKTIAETKFVDSTQSEMLAKKTMFQEMIGKLTDKVEAHAKDEEVLVQLIKLAIENPEKIPS